MVDYNLSYTGAETDALLAQVDGGFTKDVIAKTGNFSILASQSLGNNTFTNEGASGTIIFSLPTADDSYLINFYVAANQTLQVAATNSEKIRLGSDLSIANGKVQSSDQYTYFTLKAIGSEWIIINWTAALELETT